MSASSGHDLRSLRARVRAGVIDDATFDAVFPTREREASAKFWTPIAVARRAAEIMRDVGTERALDIGSGPGKFCLVTGCVAPDVEVVGVEQRPHLVDVARDLATRFDLPKVRFFVGDATRVRVDAFDALYLFNPFAENVFTEDRLFDRTVELSPSKLAADVERIERALRHVAIGTLVFTYHTFGGHFPDTFTLVHNERAGTDWLRVWRRERVHPATDRLAVEDDACEPISGEALGIKPARSTVRRKE